MASDLEKMGMLSDVPMPLHVELDQTRISIRELLELQPGDVLTLSRATGENVDVYAGDVLIGWGEILLIDSKLAVRIADLRDTPLPTRTHAEGLEASASAAEQRG